MKDKKITNSKNIHDEQRKYMLWLHCVEGVSDVNKQKLMDFFKAPRELYECERKIQ